MQSTQLTCQKQIASCHITQNFPHNTNATLYQTSTNHTLKRTYIHTIYQPSLPKWRSPSPSSTSHTAPHLLQHTSAEQHHISNYNHFIPSISVPIPIIQNAHVLTIQITVITTTKPHTLRQQAEHNTLSTNHIRNKTKLMHQIPMTLPPLPLT